MATIKQFGGFRFIKGCNAEGTTYAVSDVINYIAGSDELKNAICFVSTGADTERPNYIVFNNKAFGDAEALNQYLKNVQVSEITDSTEGTKIPQVIAVKDYVTTKIAEVNNSITNLGTAAHSNVLEGSIANETSGLTTEKQVKNYVDGEIANAIDGLDKTETASTNNLEIQIVQENGLLKTITLTEKTLKGKIADAADDNLKKLVNAVQVQTYVTDKIGEVNTTITNLGTAAKRDALSTNATISGNADSDKLVDAKQVVDYVTTTVNGLNSTGTGTSEKSGIKVEVVQTNGKITGVAVEDALGTAAKSDILTGDITGGTTSDNLVSAKQVNGLVATLDANVTSNTTTNGGINVQVVETDGKITAVNVTEGLGTVAKSHLLTTDNIQEDSPIGAIPTVKQVTDYVKSSIVSLNGAMHFKGVLESLPVEADYSGYTAGDVILVGNKEYVFNADEQEWVELGDESLYVAKATKIANIEIGEGISKDALMEALGLDKKGLDAEVSSTDNAKITVKVTEAKGKITAVNVTDSLGTAAGADVLTGTITTGTTNDGNLVTAGQVKAWTKYTDTLAGETARDVEDLKTSVVKSVNGRTPDTLADNDVTISGQHIKVFVGDGLATHPTSGVSIVDYTNTVDNAIIKLEKAIADTSKLSSTDNSITVTATPYSGANVNVNDIAVNKKVLADTDVAAGNAVEFRKDDTGALYGVMYYIVDEIPNIEIPVVQGPLPEDGPR